MKYIRIYNAFSRQLLTYQPVVDFPKDGRRPRLSMEITFWSFACPFVSCKYPSLTCTNCECSINKPLKYVP